LIIVGILVCKINVETGLASGLTLSNMYKTSGLHGSGHKD
jgi:hypothetical protein